MHNCLILGCGRSGTSLTAGLLSKAGYFFGANPIEPRDSNPKGFFEDHLVNYVNERIMKERVRYARILPRPLRAFGRGRFHRGQLWLAVLEEPTDWRPDQRTQWMIRDIVSHVPYALKDPRLSYTLNAWRPYLDDCRLICVFRHPSTAAASIEKEVSGEPFYANLDIGAAHALRVWSAMYRQILDFHCTDDSEWLFVEYDELIDGSALGTLSRFLDAPVDRDFLDKSLNRTRADQSSTSSEVDDIYRRLREKASASQAAIARVA